MDEANHSKNSNVVVSSRTYNKCSAKLVAICKNVGISLQSNSPHPLAKYEGLLNALREFLEKSGGKNVDFVKLRGEFSSISDNHFQEYSGRAISNIEELGDELRKLPEITSRNAKKDIDDISPNDFKDALLEVLLDDKLQNNIVEERYLFRKVLDRIQKENGFNQRINVTIGNFNRMHMYTLELSQNYGWFRPFGRGNKINTARIKID